MHTTTQFPWVKYAEAGNSWLEKTALPPTLRVYWCTDGGQNRELGGISYHNLEIHSRDSYMMIECEHMKIHGGKRLVWTRWQKPLHCNARERRLISSNPIRAGGQGLYVFSRRGQPVSSQFRNDWSKVVLEEVGNVLPYNRLAAIIWHCPLSSAQPQSLTFLDPSMPSVLVIKGLLNPLTKQSAGNELQVWAQAVESAKLSVDSGCTPFLDCDLIQFFSLQLASSLNRDINNSSPRLGRSERSRVCCASPSAHSGFKPHQMPFLWGAWW